MLCFNIISHILAVDVVGVEAVAVLRLRTLPAAGRVPGARAGSHPAEGAAPLASAASHPI